MDNQFKIFYKIIVGLQLKKIIRIVVFFIFLYIIHLTEIFISEYFNIPRNDFLKNKLLLHLKNNITSNDKNS